MRRSFAFQSSDGTAKLVGGTEPTPAICPTSLRQLKQVSLFCLNTSQKRLLKDFTCSEHEQIALL